jgi:Helix-hairpin-helix motif
MLPGLGLALVALAGLWSLAWAGPASPVPRPCTRAGLVDGQLRCDDELPTDPAAVCPGAGPRALERVVAGDALDRASLCARAFASPYVADHGWSRMSPAELEALAQPVDLNRASTAELESLPRIGPALARRIVEGRPYADVESLERVRGIGPASLERLRERAVVHHDPR